MIDWRIKNTPITPAWETRGIVIPVTELGDTRGGTDRGGKMLRSVLDVELKVSGDMQEKMCDRQLLQRFGT